MDINTGIVRIWIRILSGLPGIYIYIIIDIIIDKNINMDIGRRMDILYGLLDSEFRGYYISPRLLDFSRVHIRRLFLLLLD